MKKISISLTEDHLEVVDERQDEDDGGSRSEAVRQIIDEYDRLRSECEDLRTKAEDLHTRLEQREDRIDDLEEQLARRSQLEQKIEDLPDKIRDKETYQERRQRLIDQASPLQRLRWKVTGVPVNSQSE